jgi:multiple sugar transport system permease protein
MTTMQVRLRRWLRRVIDYLVMSVITTVFVSPILYLLLGSLKPSSEVLTGLSGFLPKNLSFHNYRAVSASLSSESTGYLWRFLFVSVVVAAITVLGGLVVNSLAAYSFARLVWFGRDWVFVLVLLLVIVPFESVAVPLFYLLNGHRNTVYVQSLPFIANAFSIYLFYAFFIDLPASVEEAARVDGAGPWRTFFSVIVPMSKPVFAAVMILTFLTQWGSFLWPALMVSDPSVRPLPLEISVFSDQHPPDWGQVFAFGVILVTPVLLVFLAFQRWFVASVAGSGIRG